MTEIKIPYKILKFPPAYLDGYLAINGCLSEYCIPIEFTKSNGEKWVYGFQGEIEKPIKIIDIKENRYFLISTDNYLKIVYLIDIETINPINEIQYVAQILEYKNLIILILDTNSIAIIKEPNEIQYFEHLCWDGIRENRIENGILKGTLYDWKKDKDYNKTDYELDLNTLTFKRVNELNPKHNLHTKPEVKKHNWWEIWK